jgi:hypothetical protein
MELKEFTEELKVRMIAAIDGITADQPDVLIRNSQLITSIESLVSELKQFVLKYKFRNPSEEIEFFKKIKPWFISELLYYQRLFKINLFESYNTQAVKLKYFQKQLLKLEGFMTRHHEFYHYVLSSADYMDEKYFSRSNAKHTIILDDRFSTMYDIRLSKILCNERVRNYCLTAIESPSSMPANSSLTWTGSKTDLIELIYALHAARVFNKESADLKQIATHFENVFNISLGNYYRVFQDIRLRKVNQVKFLDSIRLAFLKKVEETTA